MQEQYERDEIERERAKIIAEEEAKNLQRRLKRLQDGERLGIGSPASSRPLNLKSKPPPEQPDADNELHKLADERFKQMQEQEELVKLFSKQRQQLVQQDDPGDESHTSIDLSASPSRQPKIECAFGDEELMGLSEAELDLQCDDLFGDTPIKFKPRKDDALDAAIMEQIDLLGITIPVQHIKGKLYLIGSSKTTCELKGEQLLIRTGGGYERFDEYVPGNHRYYQRQLVVSMIKTGQGLEETVKSIVEGKKHNTGTEQVQKEAAQQTPRRRQYEAKRVSIHLKTDRSAGSCDKFSARTANSSGERKRISFRDLVQPYSLKGSRQRDPTTMSPQPMGHNPPKSKLIQNATKMIQQRQMQKGFRYNAATFLAKPRETLESDSSRTLRRGRGLRARHNFQPATQVGNMPLKGRDEVLADIQGQKEHIITKLRKTFDATNIQSPSLPVKIENEQHVGRIASPEARRPMKVRVLENLQKKYQMTPSNGQSRTQLKPALPRESSAQRAEPGTPGSASPSRLNRATNIGKGTKFLMNRDLKGEGLDV